MAVPVTRLVGWESSGPRDCGPEGKAWFEGGGLVFAEVSLRGKNQGWSRWERGLLLMPLKRQDFALDVD